MIKSKIKKSAAWFKLSIRRHSIIHTIVLISLLSLVYSCDKKEKILDESDFQSFTIIKPVNTFISKDTLTGTIRSISINHNGVYIIYRNNEIIEHFNHHFEKINSYESKGEGPGEFLNPFRVEAADYVFVADYNKLTIEIFDDELNYIETVNLGHLPWSISSNRDYGFLEVLNPGTNIMLSHRTNNLKPINSFYLSLGNSNPFDDLGFGTLTDHRTAFYSLIYKNKHFTIDLDTGESIHQFEIPMFPDKVPKMRRNGIEIPEYEFVKNISFYNDNIYLLSGIVLSSGQPLFQLNTDGAIINKILLDEPVSVAAFYNQTLYGYSVEENKFIVYNLSDDTD